MNRTLQLFATVSVASSLFITSCKKNDNPNDPSTTTTTDISPASKTQALASLALLRSTSQSFTVQAGTSKRIKCSGGTLVTFYPNSFKDKNGNIITAGNVDLQITEMTTPGDMLANRTSTTTSDMLLRSGGEMNIKATMSGQEVFANKYGLAFKAAAPTTQPMELFYGDTNNPDSITTWDIRKGGPGTYASNGTLTISDSAYSIVESAYYVLDSCTDFNWVNCDHPYDATSKFVKVHLVFPDNTLKDAYPSLNIAYPSINIATCFGPTEFNSSSHTMTFSGWAPIGPSSKIALLIPLKNGDFYYYEQAATMSEEMNINANVSRLTLAETKAKLKAL